MKININGKEIEVFTQEEVDKKLKEQKKSVEDEVKKVLEKENKKTVDEAVKKAVEKYAKEHPDANEKIEELTTKLDEATKKLEAAGADPDEEGDDDSPQVKRLRKERDEIKKEFEDFKGDVNKKIDDMQKGAAENTKEKFLKRLAGDDKELKEKIELEFDNYRPDANSESEIEERMGKAYKLATGDDPKPGALDVVPGSGSDKGDGATPNPNETKEPTENAKNIGKPLGVSQEDWDKYGDKGDQVEAPGDAPIA